MIGATAIAAGGAHAADNATPHAAPHVAAEICADVVGLEPGERAFVECAASLTSSALARTASPAVIPASAHRVRSYFYVSSDEALQRRRQACEALGYDPAGPGLGACVADLSAALLRAAHPST